MENVVDQRSTLVDMISEMFPLSFFFSEIRTTQDPSDGRVRWRTLSSCVYMESGRAEIELNIAPVIWQCERARASSVLWRNCCIRPSLARWRDPASVVLNPQRWYLVQIWYRAPDPITA